MKTSRKIFKEIAFALTDSELITKAKTAAVLSKEIDQKENALKDYVKVEKENIKKLDFEKRRNLKLVREGKEDRVVEVNQLMDYAEGKISYVYQGEVVEERVMTVEERQVEMQLDDKRSNLSVVEGPL